MNLSQLTKTTTKSKRRLGLGHGSGRVKTAGRGTKGQKARGKIPFVRYSGGSLAFVKRLPFLRGKTKHYSLNPESFVVAVAKLNELKNNSVVDIKTLIEAKIIRAKDVKGRPVKILGKSNLSAALTVKLPASKSARESIEKAGGRLEL